MGIIQGGNTIATNGLGSPIQKAGALVANDFAGQVVLGGLAIDTVGAKLWICTATNGTTTTTWTVVGTQV
jgi:hypothetical protein